MTQGDHTWILWPLMSQWAACIPIALQFQSSWFAKSECQHWRGALICHCHYKSPTSTHQSTFSWSSTEKQKLSLLQLVQMPRGKTVQCCPRETAPSGSRDSWAFDDRCVLALACLMLLLGPTLTQVSEGITLQRKAECFYSVTELAGWYSLPISSN